MAKCYKCGAETQLFENSRSYMPSLRERSRGAEQSRTD